MRLLVCASLLGLMIVVYTKALHVNHTTVAVSFLLAILVVTAAWGRVTVYEPEDCDERYRQYLEHAPRHTGPILIPIQV